MGGFCVEVERYGKGLLLVRARAVGGHVHHERSSSATVEEVDGDTLVSATVGRGELAIEVWQEVDLSAIVGALGENTGDGDAHVRLGVVSDNGSVDEEGQESVLVLASVVLEEGSGVVVAYGGIGRPLCERRHGGREDGKDGGDKHNDRFTKTDCWS